MPAIPAKNLIHQSNELAASTGFRLFGQAGITPDFPPVRVMNYAFGLILTGTATERIGLQAYDVKPWSVVCTFPDQIVSYTNTSPDLSFLYCVFDDDFMANPHLNRQVIERFGFFQPEGQPVFELSPSTGQAVRQVLDKLQTEYRAGHADFEVLVRLYLHEIFILINRDYPTEPVGKPEFSNRGQVISRRFKELVGEHFRQKKQVQEYADLLCLTPRHLSELIKTNTGQPPSHWILTMELLEAKFQLKYSARTVAEIAQNLGYPDPAYFGKVFKKAVGMPPQHYRER